MYSLPKNVYRERIDFSKIKTTVPIPNLIEIQKKSYERFLQMNRLPSEREDAGLQSVFKSVFPISDFRENSSLEFIEYSIGNWECKCGKLQGLHHLRKPCSACGATLIADPYGDRDVLCPRCGKANQARGDVCDICGNTVVAEAEVRRRRVPGARHDLRRAAQGHDSPGRLEQGPRDRRQDDPRHQGAGGLLRRHPADDRERDFHHQRHRARHRQPAAPVARRLLPLGRQDALRRADHSVSRLVGGVRVRHQEPPLRAHRPQAEVPRDRLPPRARAARGRRDRPRLPQRREAAPEGRLDSLGRQRQPGRPARREGHRRPRRELHRPAGQEDHQERARSAEEGQRRRRRDLGRRARGRLSPPPTWSIRRRAK